MSIPAGASALLILTAVSASVVSASVSGSSNAKTIDSSSGVVTETLPAATGSGTVKLFANKAISSAATLAVASGDYLNNSLNGTFLFSNYDAGTEFEAVDYATGKWAVSVVGASTQSGLSLLLLESTGSQAIASIAATVNLSIGSTVFSRGSNATNAGSGVISLKAGKTYLLRASLCFETNGSAFDETIGFFNITGNSYIGSYGRYHDAAGDSNKYASSPVAVFSPSVDSQVALRFLTANSANLNTLLAPSSIEVMELPSTESVLAGMVTPAALEYWQAKQVANGSPSNNITGFTFPLTAANFGTIGNVNGFSGATKANTNSAVFNDTSNTSVVIQSAGRYRITSSVSMDGSTGNATYSQILVNGAIVSENGFIVPATNNPEAVTTHHLANLNAGDTVSFAQIASAAGLQVSSYNYLIEQLPTLTVVNPGDVPVTTLQNGSVSVAAGTLTNSGSTTVNADVPGASITIPSAGTWRIAFEATANVQASTALEMAITDSSNVTVGP